MKPIGRQTIFVSYSESDRPVATKLRKVLEDLLGEEVWLRDFNLDGGDLLVESISAAVSEAKWLILLLSSSALESKWLKLEADLATFKALEDEGFGIIVVRLDASDLPPHLKFATAGYYDLGLTDLKDYESNFINIVDYIDRSGFTRAHEEIYCDRGADADRFTLAARRNRILFILGWAGIGKSAFVTHSVADELRKRPLVITLTRGHSGDLLARQIIHKTHSSQPIGDKSITDMELTRLAVEALKKRADKFFLCIDNAEEGLDISNQLHAYLEEFLRKFGEAGVKTHIVLPTTRNPEFPPSIVKWVDTVRLQGLANEYVKESIDRWLETSEHHLELMKMAEMDDLVALAGGHPLAAKMIALYLKVKAPEQLLESGQRKRIQLRLAQHILKSVDQSVLTRLHVLILKILSAVREPMLIGDMLAVKELKAYPLEAIHKAKFELLEWFLIEQHYEMVSVHSFLGTHFRDQLSKEESLQKSIAVDFGHYAYEKAMELNTELMLLPLHPEVSEDEEIHLSNEIFRYAVPAGRLLMSVGKRNLAEELPIWIKGTLREMVFYYYQEERDYSKALEYAEKWLKISPGDLEVLLFQARCYRNQRDAPGLEAAEKLIQRLEKADHKKRFAARIYREKALVAQFRGDIETAKTFFRKGIEINTPSPYPENRTGLAQLLLMEAEGLPYWDPEKLVHAEEALHLLEKARDDASATFDRFHLGTYIEALVITGDEETAIPLLREALADRKDDERLNYRMAEILRKGGALDEAIVFARKSRKSGASKGHLTLANILYAQSQDARFKGDEHLAQEKLGEALSSLSEFRPEFGSDKEVCDSIASKIYCARGDYDKAREHVDKYQDSNNPYTLYEQCRIAMGEATVSMSEEDYGEALRRINLGKAIIQKYGVTRELPQPLQDLLGELLEDESKIRLIIAQ